MSFITCLAAFLAKHENHKKTAIDIYKHKLHFDPNKQNGNS
jgi:hypothetical protein